MLRKVLVDQNNSSPLGVGAERQELRRGECLARNAHVIQSARQLVRLVVARPNVENGVAQHRGCIVGEASIGVLANPVEIELRAVAQAHAIAQIKNTFLLLTCFIQPSSFTQLSHLINRHTRFINFKTIQLYVRLSFSATSHNENFILRFCELILKLRNSQNITKNDFGKLLVISDRS